MDFVTFKAIAAVLPEDISVILRGRHGIGKSEVVYQVASKFDLPVMERRLSQVTEGDVIGLPYKVEKKRENGELYGVSTRFLPLDWFVTCMDEPHLIFLDEIDRASLEVQQAAFELILDRSIQGNKVHKDCRIYAAINGGPMGAMYNVNEMDPALIDRFWVTDIRPSVEEWLEWGKDKLIEEVRDFIRAEDKHLEFVGEQPEPGQVYPSRRSWKRLSDVLTKTPAIIEDLDGAFRANKGNQEGVQMSSHARLFNSLCAGFIGTEATAMFRQYLANRNRIFTANDILDEFPNYKGVLKSYRIEELNNVIEKLYDHSIDTGKPTWTQGQLDNLRAFFEMLPEEARMSMWDKLSQSDCKRENSKLFAHAIREIMIGFV